MKLFPVIISQAIPPGVTLGIKSLHVLDGIGDSLAKEARMTPPGEKKRHLIFQSFRCEVTDRLE